MLGLLVVAANEDISLMVLPDPSDESQLLAYFQFGVVEYRPIRIPVGELKQLLEALAHGKKTS